MIRVQNLYHDYEGKGSFAVNDVSFEVPAGSIYGFLGPSGSGKSTVQNILTKLLALQQGTVSYEDVPLHEIHPSFFNRVGYSFELPNLYTKLTGLENLRLHAGLFSVPTEDPRRVLDMVGLADAAHRKTAQYSKGMKQRLSFARAIINQPDLLFLDEPMSGLDPTTAARIKTIIAEKRASGVTIFMTTHNMYTADELCDQVAFLNNGRIIAADTPRNLKLAYGEKSVRIEYAADDASASFRTDTLFLDREDDRRRFLALTEAGRVETVHSQEASLEQIFVRLTGRGLS